jgi:hypothetical protein
MLTKLAHAHEFNREFLFSGASQIVWIVERIISAASACAAPRLRQILDFAPLCVGKGVIKPPRFAVEARGRNACFRAAHFGASL